MSSIYVVVVGGGMQPNTDTDPNSAGQQTDATSEAPTWSGPLCTGRGSTASRPSTPGGRSCSDEGGYCSDDQLWRYFLGAVHYTMLQAEDTWTPGHSPATGGGWGRHQH